MALGDIHYTELCFLAVVFLISPSFFSYCQGSDEQRLHIPDNIIKNNYTYVSVLNVHFWTIPVSDVSVS